MTLSSAPHATDTLGRVLSVIPGVGCTCNVVWGGIIPPPPCPTHQPPVSARCVQPCPCGCGPDYTHHPPTWFRVTC